MQKINSKKILKGAAFGLLCASLFLSSCSNSSKGNWMPKDSSSSSSIEDEGGYTKLLAPFNLKYDSSTSVVSWTSVDGASGYVVNVNGDVKTTRKITSTEYKLSEDDAAVARLISVKAIGETGETTDSCYASIVVKKMDAVSNFTYRLSDDDTNIEITGFADGIDFEQFEKNGIILPTLIDGFEVIGVASRAFYRITNTLNLVVSEGIEYVADESFASSRFKEITLPTSLKTIGESAFSSSRITKISIPRGVDTIGNNAFKDSNVEELTFDENAIIETIPEGCFDSTSIKTLTLPASLKYIEKEAFAHITSLTEINFAPVGRQSSLEIIGESAFIGDSGLKNIVFPASLLEIQATAFSAVVGQSNNFETIMFEDNAHIETIGASAFVRSLGQSFKYFGPKSGYTTSSESTEGTGNTEPQQVKIIFPSSLKTIGEQAFQGAYEEIIEFKDDSQIQTIEKQAFYQNANLVSINLPKSLEVIGDSAFNSCSKLETIATTSGDDSQLKKVSANSFGGTKWYDDETKTKIILNGVLIKDLDDSETPRETLEIDAGVKYIANGLYQNKQYTSISLPDSLIGIYENAFNGNSKIQTITIPSNVEFIEADAFNNCSEVHTITFQPGSHLKLIGANAFANLDKRVDEESQKLTTVTIPSSVETLGNGAFSGNINLATVTFDANSSLTSIGASCFYGLTKLTSFVLPDNVESIGAMAFGIDANAETGLNTFTVSNQSKLVTIGDSAFYNQKFLTSFNLPDSVESIASNAFYNTQNLEEFKINSTSHLKELQNSVFNGSGINTFVIPATMEYLSAGAFSGATKLTNITFDANSFSNALDENKVIFADTFRGCTSLVEIHLPQNILTIEGAAFYGCSSLQNITTYATQIDSSAFDGTLFADSFEDGLITLNHVLIKYSGNASEIVLPNDIVTINQYAFSHLDSLTSISLPASLETIYEDAFSSCVNLKTITIPANSSLKTIANSAFANCSALTEFNFTSELVEIAPYAFLNCSSLTSVDLSKTKLETISFASFANCRKLQNLTLPQNLETIEGAAFYFDSINEINIPKTVKSIGEYAFAFNIKNANATPINFVNYDETSVLKTIETHKASILESINNYQFSIENISFANDGLLENVDSFAFMASNIEELLLPETPNSNIFLASDSFSYAYKLQKVTFEMNVSFELGVLRNATSLKQIEHNSDILTFTAFGNTMSSLPTSLEKIIISDGSTAILTDAFNGYSFVKEIVLPTSIKTVGPRAFYGCRSLTSINLTNVESIGDEAFFGCTNLSTITTGNSLLKVGSNAFLATAYLNAKRQLSDEFIIVNNVLILYNGNKKTVNIPSGVVAIAGGAFVGNTDVEEIIAPSSLTYIAYGAFSGNDNLKTLDLKACSSVVEIELYIFDDLSSDFKVVVSNKDNYLTDENIYWKLYRDYLKA